MRLSGTGPELTMLGERGVEAVRIGEPGNPAVVYVKDKAAKRKTVVDANRVVLTEAGKQRVILGVPVGSKSDTRELSSLILLDANNKTVLEQP